MDNIDTIIGTSVGAIIGFLVNIGYKPKEIFDVVLDMKFDKLINLSLARMFTEWGLDSGKRIIKAVTTFMEHKNIDPKINFEDLFELTKKKLVITTVCLDDKKIVYFSHETHPSAVVLDIIRMAFSIPFMFIPTKYEDKIYIDCGIACNYPTGYCDNIDETIGINLISDNSYQNINLENYILNIIQCFSVANCGENKGMTIKINCNINLIDFSIKKKMKRKMFSSGYQQAISSLETL